MSRHIPDTTPDPFEADDLLALEAALAGTPPHSAEDRAWSDLVAMVREEPPRRDPIARVALDHKVAQGFEKRSPAAAARANAAATSDRSARSGADRTWLDWLRPAFPAFAVLALGAVVILTALSVSGSDSDDSASSSVGSASTASAATAAPEADAGTNLLQDSAALPASPQSAAGGSSALKSLSRKSATLTQSQSFIRATQLELTTSARGLQDAADGVVDVTSRVGGIVETSQVDVTSSGGSATFVLQVPTSKLSSAVAGLRKLGNVKSVSSDADNVTDQVVSLRDQLTDARAERDALVRALDKTVDPAQITSLRRRLTAARQEVARRRSSVVALARQTDRARIDVSLSGRGKQGAAASDSDDDTAWGPGDALRDAVRGLAVAAGVGIVLLAILLPLGLLGGAGSFAAGTFKRRRREAALDAA